MDSRLKVVERGTPDAEAHIAGDAGVLRLVLLSVAVS